MQTFRQDVSTIRLVNKEAEETDSLEAQDDQERKSNGSFVGFVLLSDISWDKEQLIYGLKAEWGLEANAEEDASEDAGY